MTLDELATLKLWDVLPAGVKKVLVEARSQGWELHGKGATIAFRLDRSEDELDLPLYVQWEIGVTPKGSISLRGGKGGVPHMKLSTADVMEYLSDPSIVYPLEDDQAEKLAEMMESTPPWDETKEAHENLCASLSATLVDDKPAPKPLRLGASPDPSASRPSSPTSPEHTASKSGALKVGGTQSSARSTETVPLRLATTPLRVGSSVTHAASEATSST